MTVYPKVRTENKTKRDPRVLRFRAQPWPERPVRLARPRVWERQTLAALLAYACAHAAPALLPDVRGWLLRPGRRVRTFAALKPAECVRCLRVIRPGELVTKGRAAGRSHGNLHPVCTICEPITIHGNVLDYFAAAAAAQAQREGAS